MASQPTINWTLSKWLAFKTDHARDLVIASVNALDPEFSAENCRNLVAAHGQFRQLVNPVYDDPIMQRMFVEVISERGGDLVSSTIPKPDDANIAHAKFSSKLPVGLVPRMAWFYASQYVDRGLAQLSFMARLADSDFQLDFESHGRVWNAFKCELDQLDLSEADEERLAIGVQSALKVYCRFLNLG